MIGEKFGKFVFTSILFCVYTKLIFLLVDNVQSINWKLRLLNSIEVTVLLFFSNPNLTMFNYTSSYIFLF